MESLAGVIISAIEKQRVGEELDSACENRSVGQLSPGCPVALQRDIEKLSVVSTWLKVKCKSQRVYVVNYK